MIIIGLLMEKRGELKKVAEVDRGKEWNKNRSIIVQCQEYNSILVTF